MTRDAVVIGAGVNGLAVAGLLAKAGRKAVVLERRSVGGGSAATEEIAPGFRVDTALHDVGWVPPALVEALDLGGAQQLFVRPDPSVFAPLPDGGHLLLHADPVKSAESIRRFSSADAERWPAFAALLSRLAGFLETAYSRAVPRVPGERLRDLMQVARLAVTLRRLGRHDTIELLRVLPMSVAELLDDWFESDSLKGAVGAAGITGIRQGPRSGGTAFVLLHHHVGCSAPRARSVVRGGVAKWADALAAAARRFGAELRTGVGVREILVRDGHAAGVVTESGEVIETQFVVSSADPRTTLLGLVDPSHLDPDVTRAVRAIRFRGAVAKVNLALDGLPSFTTLPGDGLHLRGAISLGPSLDYLERAYDDAKHGRASGRPYLEARIPSLHDPSLAPAGKHVMSVWAQYIPYSVKRETLKDRAGNGYTVGDTVLKVLEEYAPGITSLVLHRQVLTPNDLEERYGATEGCLYHGEMGLDQILFMRPIAGWGRYRTPIRGLYLCGAGTHPGGGMGGASGALAARMVLQDVRGWRAWAS